MLGIRKMQIFNLCLLQFAIDEELIVIESSFKPLILCDFTQKSAVASWHPLCKLDGVGWHTADRSERTET
jgi:hypothetical protein